MFHPQALWEMFRPRGLVGIVGDAERLVNRVETPLAEQSEELARKQTEAGSLSLLSPSHGALGKLHERDAQVSECSRPCDHGAAPSSALLSLAVCKMRAAVLFVPPRQRGQN